MKKLALALAVASLSTAASADTIIGAVSGLVQARNSQTLMNVRAGMRIPDGYELQVPARGSATISMPGCSATVGPGTTPLTLNSCMQTRPGWHHQPSFRSACASGSGSGGRRRSLWCLDHDGGGGLCTGSGDHRRGQQQQ